MAGCSIEQTQATSPSPSPTPSLTAVSAPTPVASITPSSEPSSDPFQDANNIAIGATNLSKSAQSPHEWDYVFYLWKQAISLMKAVPKSSQNYALAQKKVTEYQSKLAIAKQNINHPPKGQSEETEAPTQLASQPKSKPIEAPTSTARDFLEDYLKYIITKGGTGSGTGYFCKETEELSSSLFAPRSYQILDISGFPGKHGIPEASATVRIDSSNRGGAQITADWNFYMKKGPAVVAGTPGGWCMELISEK